MRSCDPDTAFEVAGHYPLLEWDICAKRVVAVWVCGYSR